MSTFDAVIRRAAPPLLSGRALEDALTHLGVRGMLVIDHCNHARKVAIISAFVHGITQVPVQELVELERRLLVTAHALPEPHREVSVQDALSLIALRNYVRYLAVCLGFGWSDGMMLQVAFSDLGRVLLDERGGLVRFTMDTHDQRVTVAVAPRSGQGLPITSLENWCASLPPHVRRRPSMIAGDVIVSMENTNVSMPPASRSQP